jgi:hypothetical protein
VDQFNAVGQAEETARHDLDIGPNALFSMPGASRGRPYMRSWLFDRAGCSESILGHTICHRPMHQARRPRCHNVLGDRAIFRIIWAFKASELRSENRMRLGLGNALMAESVAKLFKTP